MAVLFAFPLVAGSTTRVGSLSHPLAMQAQQLSTATSQGNKVERRHAGMRGTEKQSCDRVIRVPFIYPTVYVLKDMVEPDCRLGSPADYNKK